MNSELVKNRFNRTAAQSSNNNIATITARALCAAFILVLLSAGTASAATITVDDSGGADYMSIQAAVNNASGGDVIQVAAGNYYEHVVVNKSVILQGESNSTTIIDGSGSGNVVEVTVDGVNISGFKVQNGSCGMYITSSNNVFSDNSIINMVGTNGESGSAGGIGSGIYFSGSTNNTLSGNTISNITGGIGGTGGFDASGGAGGIGSGIYFSGSTNNTLSGNTISSITGGTGGTGGGFGSGGAGGVGSGIYFSGSTNNTLSGNTISSITGGIGGTGGAFGSGGSGGIGSGIFFSGSTNNTLSGNTISNITGGIGGTGGSDGSGGAGGIGSGIYLSGSINNTLSGNSISNMTGGTGGTGGALGYDGADGIGFGVFLNSDSYQNHIDLINTVDGDPVLYFYDVDGGAVENYVLTANSNPTNLGKIVLINSTNMTINNNIISNFTGTSGGTGGSYGSGGSGGIGSGIYLSGSTNNTLSGNTISSITGGIGGTGGAFGSGSSGGIGSGIYLSGSTNNTLSGNTLSNITGGMGGTGGLNFSGGAGGVGSGIYLSGSTNNTLSGNTISKITGGIGGTGGFQGSGGAGGVGSGIYFSGSTNNTLLGNTISSITGGIGGTGGPFGSGGTVGVSFGMFLDSGSYPNIGDSTNTIDGIQTLPPETILNSYMPDPTNNTTLHYTGDAVDSLSNIMRVEYRIRGGVWTPASPIDGLFNSLAESFEFTTPQLEDGTYTIEVRAINVLNQIDQNYALDTITIDSGTPPTISIAYPTPASTTGTNTTLIASTNEPATLKYDFVDVNYTQMNYTFSSTGLTTHTTIFSNLPAGFNTLYVGAADFSGNINNTTANVTWIVDASGPQLSQVLINDQVTDDINSDPNIKTTITSPFSTITAVEYFIDTVGADGTGIVIAPSGTTTQNIDLILDIAALSDGDHTIYLHAANQMGWGGYQAAAFTIDTTPPVINIVSPQNGTTLVTSVVTITGTVSDASDVALVTVNGEPAAGTTNWDADVTLIDGENNITIVATDDIGNTRSVVLTVYYNPSAVIISMGSAEVSSNSLVTIPVSIANAMNITGISFDLFYNSSVVSVDSIAANNSFTGSSVSSNVDNINGTTRVVLTNTNLISSSTQTPVIDVTFNVTGDFGSLTNLDLENVELSNSDFNPDTPVSVVDGLITVGINGDLNDNGYVDIGDVAKVAFMVAGKVPEELSADFNDNGYVDIGDAAKIAFYLAGKVSEL